MAKQPTPAPAPASVPDIPQAGAVLSHPGKQAPERSGQPIITELPDGTIRTDY